METIAESVDSGVGSRTSGFAGREVGADKMDTERERDFFSAVVLTLILFFKKSSTGI